MTPKDVLKMAKEKGVRIVDLRFTAIFAGTAAVLTAARTSERFVSSTRSHALR